MIFSDNDDNVIVHKNLQNHVIGFGESIHLKANQSSYTFIDLEQRRQFIGRCNNKYQSTSFYTYSICPYFRCCICLTCSLTDHCCNYYPYFALQKVQTYETNGVAKQNTFNYVANTTSSRKRLYKNRHNFTKLLNKMLYLTVSFIQQ